MRHWMTKVGMIAGSIAGVAGALAGIPFLPTKYQPVVAAVGTIAGTVAGLYHPTPTAQP